MVCQSRGPFFSHDDKVNGRQFCLMAAKKLAEQAFHPIPLHRFSQALGYDQPQPGPPRNGRGQGHPEMTGV